MDAALANRGLSKSFGSTRAVDQLDLTVPRGSTYGLIGPSGAGKTTAIRMILSILLPDEGTLEARGRPSALEATHRIGYLPEERGVYRKMRVAAFLTYLGRLKSVAPELLPRRIARPLSRVALADAAARRCEDLSRGMLQRLQFVGAIINEPEMLILDKHFSGLDPVNLQVLKALVEEQQHRGATILFSAHVMAQAEELCQQVVMIHQGRTVLDEPVSALLRQYDRQLLRLEPLDATADLLGIRSLPDVAGVELTKEGCDVRLVSGADPSAAMRAIAARVPPARIELTRLRLEDVFVRLVTDATDGTGLSDPAMRARSQALQTEGASAA